MFGNTCKCPKCGTHNNEDRETCRTCGIKLNGSEISNKKEKPKKKVEKLTIWIIILISLVFVIYTGGLEVKSIPMPEAVELSNIATEKSLKDDLINIYEFDIKTVEISGDCVYISIYDTGTWTDDDKKIVVTTLAQITQRKMNLISGTTVYLCEEHGIKLASARGNPDKGVRQIRVY